MGLLSTLAFGLLSPVYLVQAQTVSGVASNLQVVATKGPEADPYFLVANAPYIPLTSINPLLGHEGSLPPDVPLPSNVSIVDHPTPGTTPQQVIHNAGGIAQQFSDQLETALDRVKKDKGLPIDSKAMGKALADACPGVACLKIGPNMANLSDGANGGLQMGFSLLSANFGISGANFAAVSRSTVSILELFGQLARMKNVSIDNVAGTNISLDELALALQAALNAKNQAAIGTQLGQIANFNNNNTAFRLNQFLVLGNSVNAVGNIQINTLDWLFASAQTASYNILSFIPNNINIDLGIARAQVACYVMTLPTIGCGEAGMNYCSGGVRLKVELVLGMSQAVDLGFASLQTQLASFGLFFEIGSSCFRITNVDMCRKCVWGAANPGGIKGYWGSIPDAKFFNRNHQVVYNDVVFNYLGKTTFTIGPFRLPLVFTTIEVPGLRFGIGIGVRASEGAIEVNNPPQKLCAFPGMICDGIDLNAILTAALGACAINANFELYLEFPYCPPIIKWAVNSVLGRIVSTVGQVALGLVTPILGPILNPILKPILSLLGPGMGFACATVYGLDESCPPKVEPIAGTCNGETSQNDAKIVLTEKGNYERFGISTGSVYTGPNYAGAAPITGSPMNLTAGVSNRGGVYTVRLYRGSSADGDVCIITKDITVTIPRTECVRGSIGDYVWKDANDNGQQDAGETPIPNVVMELYRNGVLSTTALTNAQGNYSFGNLTEAVYQVKILKSSLPDECQLARNKDAGLDDAIDSDFDRVTGSSQFIRLVPESGGLLKNNPTVDAGLVPRKGTLGDYVWFDDDNDGIQDAGERGVPGVTMELLQNNLVVQETTTDEDGKYLFMDLENGEYSVQMVKTTLPASFTLTKVNQGGNDAVDSDFDPVTARSGSYTINIGIPSQRDILTVDGGLYGTGNVVIGRVWCDTNKDGIQDADERNLPGIQLQAYSGGTPIGTPVITDKIGRYTQVFPNTAGTYSMRVVPNPALVYLHSPAGQGPDRAKDSDFTNGISANTSFPSRVVVLDAGIYVPIKVSGFVWRDTNDNGQQNGEPAVADVTLELFQDGNLIGSTTTGSNGEYSFTDLFPGEFYVRVRKATLPPNTAVSLKPNVGNDNTDSDFMPTPGTSATIVLTDCQTARFDLALSPRGSLGDLVWKDANNDGLQQGAERGVAGVTLRLFRNGVQVATDTTDTFGKYLFSNLIDGIYTLQLDKGTVPAECALSVQKDQGTNDAIDSDFDATTGESGSYTIVVTDPNRRDILTADAALYGPKGALGDYVWKDTNNNGQQDAGEPNVAGVTIELYKGTTKIGQQTTDPQGNYLFTDLTAGIYKIKVVKSTIPAQCELSNNANLGDDKKDSDVDPVSGESGTYSIDPFVPAQREDLTADVGIVARQGSLGDFVWKDTNNNGLQDSTEVGAKGIYIDLYKNGGSTPVASAVTDVSGLYLFSNLDAGTYKIKVRTSSLPAWCRLSGRPNTGTDDGIDTDVDPVTGESGNYVIDPLDDTKRNILTVDVGLFSANGSLGDFVWKDRNNDGIQSAVEIGFKGVIVELYKDGVYFAKDTTDADGNYLFPNLSKGTYKIKLIKSSIPAPCEISNRSNATTDERADSDVDPTTGESDEYQIDPADPTKKDIMTVDAALVNMLGSLGDYVWKDANNNGVQGNIEGGVKGIIVELYKDGAYFAKDTTDGVGKYLFENLPAGTYKIKLVQSSIPAGCVIALQKDAGTDDGLDSDVDPVTGESGNYVIDPRDDMKRDILTVDAGLQVRGSLGDFVWKDANNNGIQDAGEPGVEGVVLQLYRNKTLYATTTTDAQGKYLFAGLTNGFYYVQVVPASLPAQCLVTPKIDTGGDDARDSDADPEGKTIEVQVDPTDPDFRNIRTIDIGLYTPKGSLGDYVWKDRNSDGLQDSTEVGVEGVVIQLFRNGSMVATTTTDSSGRYLFANLDGGTYNIKIDKTSLPGLCRISILPNAGNDEGRDSDVDPETGESTNYVIDPFDPTKRDIMTVDAAVSNYGSLGDFVWLDATDNGIQGADDTPVGGVVIELYKDDQLYAKTTTDSKGKYLFDYLDLGNYYIKVDGTTIPAGTTISSKPNVPPNDATDSDVYPTTKRSAVYPIDPYDANPLLVNNPTLDVGLYNPLGSIGNYIWKDTNNNGLQDSTEVGVKGVILELVQSNTVVTRDTTNAEGLYLFNNLTAGVYQVRIVRTSLPTGCDISTRKDIGADDALDADFDPITGTTGSYTISTTPGVGQKDINTVDGALYSARGSLGDYVWKDSDNDGVQDASEAGVPNVQIELYKNGALAGKDTTDAQGKYLFVNLDAGTYKIKVLAASLPADCAISGRKDTPTDDTNDSDVDPITGESGSYTINPAVETLKDILTVDAALFVPRGSLGDFIWKDTNNDGLQVSTERGVTGIIVELYRIGSTSAIARDTTDETGRYLFSNLPPGTYKVRILSSSLPQGCLISPKMNTGTDDTRDSDFNAGTGESDNYVIDPLDPNKTDIRTVDGALYSPTGSLGDRVWKDLNDNGLQDAGEPGVAQVTIWLYRNGAAYATQQTNAQGNYLFSELPQGVYNIKVITGSLPTGCLLSESPKTGNDDTKDSDVDPTTAASTTVIVNPYNPTQKDITTLDVGLYAPNGSLGDRVWKDLNRNGVQDSNEQGVKDVIIQLYRNDVLVRYDTTDVNGNYLFTGLDKASYRIKVVQSSILKGCEITMQNSGSDDSLDSDVNQTTGESDIVEVDPTTMATRNIRTPDVGLAVKVAFDNPYGSLGDRVWKDRNNNGLQDIDEPGVPGVRIQLFQDNQVTPVSSTTTDAQGKYVFTTLSQGVYRIKVDVSTLPASCSISSQPQTGTDDALDSDVSPSTGESRTVTVNPSNPLQKDITTLDAGLVAFCPTLPNGVSLSLCSGTTVPLSVTGMTNISTENIRLVYFTSSQTSASVIYGNGGTVLGTVTNASLTAAKTTATLNNVSFPANTTNAPITYYVYAQLDPASPDLACRPFSAQTVTVLPVFTPTITGSRTVCAGQTTSLTASAGSSYRWSTNATTQVLTVNAAGTYSVTVMSAAGCSGTATINTISAPTPSVVATSATICVGETATLQASGASSYLWSTSASTASIQVSGTATTTYSVTGRNASGCQAVATGTLTVNGGAQLIGITQGACVNNVASLTINAINTGAGTLEYSINGEPFTTNNVFTINAPISTLVNVVVRTQGSTCQATETVQVNCACQTPASLTFVPTTLQTCAGQPVNFTANVSGASSASLSSNGTGTFSQIVISGRTTVSYLPSTADAQAGSVTLTLTSADPDGNGICQPTQLMRVLTINPIPTILTTSATVCAGATGVLSASGAATYRWSMNGVGLPVNTATLSVTASGVYSVTGLSAQGCASAPATATLTVNPSVVVMIAPQNVSLCAGQTHSLSAINGNSTYRWSTGATTSVISVSAAGTYSVTATSPGGCVGTATVGVTANPTPTVTVSSTTICRGQTTMLTASGGTNAGETPSYLWSTGANTASIQVSTTATAVYSVTGTTLAGCSASASGTVTVNGQPQINSITQSTACVGTVASLTVNATNNGAGTLEYSLNGGAFQTANSFTINAPDSITATVMVRTQGSTCQATETVLVNCACQTPASLTFVPTTLQTCAGQPVSFTVNVSGASSATLTSSGSGTLSQAVISGPTAITYRPSVADAQAGSVTFTLTSADPDGNGSCGAEQMVRLLTVNPVPNVVPTSSVICEGQTIELIASGASTYRWSTGATTAAISVSVAGTYSVTGISAQGCVGIPATATLITQVCEKVVDLALKKYIDKKRVVVGETVTYTIKVWNESGTPATGVVVKDTLNPAVEYLTSTASRGSYDPATKRWTIGNIGANGDTVRLVMQVKVLKQGVWYNTAEINSVTERDVDSTPNNNLDSEDDQDRQCFTVPVELCPGKRFRLQAPATAQNGVWTRTVNGQSTTIGTGITILIDQVGLYTFAASNGGCSGDGCCPIEVVAGINCVLPPQNCVLTLSGRPGVCDPATGTHSLTGVITFANAPTTGVLTVQAGGKQQTFTAPFTSPLSYSLTGLPANGQTQTISAVFSASGACQVTLGYVAPANCQSGTAASQRSVVAQPTVCNPQTGQYAVSGTVSFTNGPATGTMTISVDGQSQTFYAPLSSPQAYTFTGMSSDGSTHTVQVIFSDKPSLSSSTPYMAPANCLNPGGGAAPCGTTLTVVPGACQLASNTFILSGVVSLSNAPSTGIMTITTAGRSLTYAAPFGATQAYSFNGLVSDGSSQQVQVSFSANPVCGASVSYQAPEACSPTQCAVGIQVNTNGTVCSPNGYALNVTISLVNPPASGVLTVSTAGQSLTFGAPFNSPMGLVLTSLTATGSQSITASFGSGCSATTGYQAPNCTCVPSMPTAPSGNLTACIGQSFPTLTAMVSGSATLDWYTVPTGGVPVAVGTLSFTPSGTVANAITYYVQARSTAAGCNSEVNLRRVPVPITVFDCNKVVDLALRKFVSKSRAALGETITYTVQLWNESNTPATGVVVKDTLNAGIQYLSSTATQGSYNVGTGLWSIGTVPVNTTITLTMQVRVLAQGIWYNTAEISSVNERDTDSTPGNDNINEDDQDRKCFTVPIQFCPGEQLRLSVPAASGVWTRTFNGQSTTVGTGSTITVDQVGTYTFTSQTGGCGSGGCCPVEIVEGTTCCPTQICIPFTIKKRVR